jgi:hypothetical protein
MALNRILLAFLFLTPCFFSYSQNSFNTYNIRKEKGLLINRCKKYRTIVNSFPEDIRFGIELIDRDIFVIFPSEEDLMQLMDRSTDGIAIDIVHKDQYSCNSEVNLASKWPNRGFLLRPFYKKEIVAKMYLDRFRNVVIPIGVLPEHYDPNEIEINVLILQKKALCEYDVISDIEFSNWELLETGLYWDSIPMNHRRDVLFTESKSMDFYISFDKNKIEVDSADVKQIYNQLELGDHEISEIYVNAYTSIEGTSDRNIALQSGRAQSILDTFQDLQSKKIKTQISTSENWKQFAKDIKGTKYEYLKRYSKDEIKNLLTSDLELQDSLEPILQKQRIGHIRIVLEQKLTVANDDPESILRLYQESISMAKLQKALYFQELIFTNIREGKSPDELVEKLEVPRESKYGPLFNNIILFNLERYNYDLLEAIEKFEYLLTLLPYSYKIKYNLVALKIKAWSAGSTEEINRDVLKKMINDLDKTDIQPALMKRLKINYNMILVQYLDYEKEFKAKERYIRSIVYNYRNSDLSQNELLSIARYLSFNSKFNLAMEVLSASMLSENVSEEILFYYLRLALVYPSNSKISLDTICQKALEKNNERFCRLFLPKSLGGFTFQLRENSEMNKLYCEHCNQDVFYSELKLLQDLN